MSLEFQRFDDHSKYRLYRSADVRPGRLHITVTNQHATDGVVFEQWADDRGRTFAQVVEGASRGGGFAETEVEMHFLERLVWVGHWTEPRNTRLDGDSGWRLDFVRVS